MGKRVRSRGEAALVELRHRLVEIQQQRDADDTQGQRSEGKEVRQAVDLHEVVVEPSMRPRECPGGPDEEREVLPEIHPDPGSLMTLNAKTADSDTGNGRPRFVGDAPEGEYVDLMPGGHQRLGL